ncbi:uncharacterized protein LOC142644261 [Castanea sativa]|uniref:uncharacterized protein LOC142644261 n=1 Tax=Castanea sativa TaxID=21020 RepID=UPI003F64D3B0
MQKAAEENVKKCEQCQRYAPNIHQPGRVLTQFSSPWSFAQWGLDIVGPFSKAAGNRRWLLVGTDYITKWVEAKPLSNIRDVDAKGFIWRNIAKPLGGTVGSWESENRYSNPAYLQGNGQDKEINKAIVSGLKKRLDNVKGRWVDELPHVLWTYHTAPRRSIGETPFSMTYGSKAVIPLEVGFPTLKTDQFSVEENNRQLSTSLELIEERREVAMVKMAHY